MENKPTTGGGQEPNGGAPEKTFTQGEMDAIIGERLAREREKYADYDILKAKAAKFDESEDAQKTELQKAQEKASSLETELNEMKAAKKITEIRSKVAKETGVPAELLHGNDEETCKAQADAIKKFAGPSYPNVLDGGEPNKPPAGKTRDQFATWFDETMRK